jgi:hypothetical protein
LITNPSLQGTNSALANHDARNHIFSSCVADSPCALPAGGA